MDHLFQKNRTAQPARDDDNNWRPLGRKYTNTMIVERIQRLLEDGQLRPGSKLPPERDLAEQLGVSRSSLREALKALTLMGVLESRVADGTYVRASASTGLADSLQFSILLRSKTSFLELIEARVYLETNLVRLATQKITEAKLNLLERELEILGSLVQTVQTFNEHDTKFHLMIAEAAENEVMFAFAKVLQRMAAASRHKTAYRYDLSKTCSEHGEIVKQIRARNAEAACRAMEKHLDGVRTVTLASDYVDLQLSREGSSSKTNISRGVK